MLPEDKKLLDQILTLEGKDLSRLTAAEKIFLIHLKRASMNLA